jgi:hypothetical protein
MEELKEWLPYNTWRFVCNWRIHAAHSLALFYGAHLYLVGSSLSRDDAGDFDLRIPLSDADWFRLFGNNHVAPENYLSEEQIRKHREELKLNRRHGRWCGHQWRYDFQFQREGIFWQKASEGVYLQLDSVPDELLASGRTDP